MNGFDGMCIFKNVFSIIHFLFFVTPYDLAPGEHRRATLAESCIENPATNTCLCSQSKWMYVATEIEINIRLKKRKFYESIAVQVVVGPSVFGLKVSVSPELVRLMPIRASH